MTTLFIPSRRYFNPRSRAKDSSQRLTASVFPLPWGMAQSRSKKENTDRGSSPCNTGMKKDSFLNPFRPRRKEAENGK